MCTKLAYDFSLPSLDGSSIALGEYKNQPILLTNTASKCGFTPQYEGLQAIWSRYRKQGLVVIGIPSDQFGHQELDSNEEIAAFCYKNYGVSFPIAAKSPVKGNGRIPLFAWLAAQGGILSYPRWNFYKYIINRQGKLATWFTSVTPPDSRRCIKALEQVIYDF